MGNLETRRAIIDVRDVVRAFDLSLDKATMGEVYNLSGNRVYAIQEIVDILHRLTGFDFELWQDPKLLRPTDEPIIFGDSRKFQQETGWQQEIPLEKLLGICLSIGKRSYR